MRIGLLCHRLSMNDGEGRVNYEIAMGAARAGHDVVVVATYFQPGLPQHPRITWVRIPGHSLPAALLRNVIFAIASTIWLSMNRGKLDIVHSSGANSWGRSDLISVHFLHTTWRRSPYFRRVPGLRGFYHDVYSRWGMLLESRMLATTGPMVCVSELLRRDIAQLGSARHSVQVIENGIDTQEFAPGPADRARLGLPEGATIALFVGELHTARKNLETVLRTMPLVPNLHLAIVGSQKGRHLHTLVNELGIGDRVHFLGFIVDMPSIYRAVDLFVFPSRYEPWGMVVAEALATGLGVVTSGTTGASSMVTPEAGVVIDNPEDIQQLAAAIRGLTADSSKRDRLKAGALKTVEGRSWRSMADSYVALYERIKQDRERDPSSRPQ